MALDSRSCQLVACVMSPNTDTSQRYRMQVYCLCQVSMFRHDMRVLQSTPLRINGSCVQVGNSTHNCIRVLLMPLRSESSGQQIKCSRIIGIHLGGVAEQ